jgi:hypothetical protein
MQEALFENYELFITEHSDELSTPAGAVKMITDNGMFRSYMEALTEGLEPAPRTAVLAVANRQREMILNESANVGASSQAFGWTVLSFPILADIYAEPIISELCNVYPVSSPVASIPRIKIMAEVQGYDGSVNAVRIPTMLQTVRPSALTLSIAPAAANDVYGIASAAVSPAVITTHQYRINRRYTIITQITNNQTVGGVTTAVVSNLVIKPDNRNQFVGTFTFVDGGSTHVAATLTGHINYDTGIMSYQVLYSAGSTGYTFAAASAVLTIRFIPINTMNGRIKVKISTEMTDVTIDQNEDFLIELPPEDVQDFRAIFKMDILRTLSEAIKRQILLNKDGDLAFYLKAAEADMATAGTALTLNLGDYDNTGSKFEPTSPLDIFKAVIPKISYLTGLIRRNFNMYPSYMVCGLKTAALLRSLQSFAIAMPGISQGDGAMGWAGDMAQFIKMKVLESNAIENGKIYLSTKAPNDALEKCTIVDLVYQPIYIVTEVTDGNTRNFVRARTLIEIPRTDGLGVINFTGGNANGGLDTYFG